MRFNTFLGLLYTLTSFWYSTLRFVKTYKGTWQVILITVTHEVANKLNWNSYQTFSRGKNPSHQHEQNLRIKKKSLESCTQADRLWDNCSAYRFDYKDLCLGFKTRILITWLLAGKWGIFRVIGLPYCELLALLPFIKKCHYNSHYQFLHFNKLMENDA